MSSDSPDPGQPDVSTAAAPRLRKRTNIVSALIVAAILLATLITWRAVSELERHQLRLKLEIQSDRLNQIVQATFDEAIFNTRSIAAFFNASNEVTREEFSSYCSHLLEQGPMIHALEWIPRVEHGQRTAIETAARQQGFDSFHFKAWTETGTIISPEKETYFPVYFIEPLASNEGALGFDLASSPTRLEALNRALETKQAAVTAPIELVQDEGHQAGILVFYPIYGANEDLKGFALGVFRVGELIKNVIDQAGQTEIASAFFDLSATGERTLLYQHPQLSGGSDNSSDTRNTVHSLIRIDVAGRTWELACSPTAAFYANHRSHYPEIVLIGATLLCLLVTIYLRSRIRTELILSARVEERTRELAKARDAANAANEGKGRFLANVSHEIRSPLTGIIGVNELLLHTHLDPQQQKYQRLLKQSAESLLSILNDILDSSKIEAGKLELVCEPFDLRSTVDDIISFLQPQALDQQLELAYVIAEDVPHTVGGDASRLRQILVNLITNALKFTKAGSIALEIHCTEHDEAQTTLQFTVIDTGFGIPEEKLKTIFQPFSQADMKAADSRSGTGLGLTICQQLVELMEGRIWVESRVGKGSSFHFTARFENAKGDDTAQNRLPNHAESPGTTDTRHIDKAAQFLLVEDGRINQIVAVKMLKNLGYSVSVAGNGREALEKIQTAMPGTFAAILMDMQMPEMDGFELTREIRSRENQGKAHLPIIAMTAYAMKGDREKCMAAGMDAYIRKPIRHEALEKAIKKIGIANA